MTRTHCRRLLLALAIGFLVACSKPATEKPFAYSFIKEAHLQRPVGTDYSEYKAFYVLTEDFEPIITSPADIEQMRDGMRFAAGLSARYEVPWTHFVDVNTLAPAFVGEDAALSKGCREMIADLKSMVARGDDCQLHLHGALDEQLLEWLQKTEKLHVKKSSLDAAHPYRQRRSFFYNAFYAQGGRKLVASLTYGKRLLEKSIYDYRQAVLAFRPGGWDHGSNDQDTRLYYHALMDAGLIANSGLSTGNFGSPTWRVGNDVGHNLATITFDNQTITEVSPTAAPTWYVNPVVSQNIKELVEAAKNKNEMVVIVSVYHLGALQTATNSAGDTDQGTAPYRDIEIQQQREALERHFQLLAELRRQKIIYPITLRELLTILSQQAAVLATSPE